MTREEAIHFAECLKHNYTINFADMEVFCDMAIKSLKQEIKMGRWVIVDDEYGDNSICECSECKDRVWMYKSADQKWNYCPNCGLRMESEVQNDRTN
jgi:hypothetical protein